MEEDSKFKQVVVGGMGAIGLGALAAVVTFHKIGIWIGLAIILMALLIFGGYFLFKRARAKRQSRMFESAVESQTSASPKAISDPNRRAALDKLRQKFQTGLQEFKSRGKDIYKLPWYVIIGESGSGKTEAIRHSGVEFPPGLQDELQGSGGTVNMDWWFTNRSIILDTAGSMIFNEAQAGEIPEWREFLRLLKKARPSCPVNGLFLVLSVESLIKDSSDKIAQKASRLAQQLDMIQRTLDVRFPVYLLVTKCDLLTGFREFFDNIEDPQLQHQMFGWSNPDPLDSHFRPELVEQHLKTVAESVSRRRLALLREGATGSRFGDTQFFVSSYQKTGATTKRRLDEVDAFFALPESVLRLAPRLRRYLETIFVAGEWSAKPVFLRGIYFTSSMREGRALDEAMALATGVSLEQLPEDRSWEKNRSYFMRDLFLEKVFREYGLVTRATNTLKLVRNRQFLILGVISVALLLLLVFAFFSYQSLQKSVAKERDLWNIGAGNWKNGMWEPSIVRSGDPGNLFHFTYAGGDPVPGGKGMTAIEYQSRLKETIERPLSVGLLFAPMKWLNSGKDMNRPLAEELIFEGGVLKPLVGQVRNKMERPDASPSDPAAIERHRDALLSLIRLEADRLSGVGFMNATNSGAAAGKYLGSFISYLTDSNQISDTNLVEIFQWNYAGNYPGRHGPANPWPPTCILEPNGGDSLSNNPAIKKGLDVFGDINKHTQENIDGELVLLGDLVDKLYVYDQTEKKWLAAEQTNPSADISAEGQLFIARKQVEKSFAQLQTATNFSSFPLTNLSARYGFLEKAAMDASTSTFQEINKGIPEASKTVGIFADISEEINRFSQKAAGEVRSKYLSVSDKMVVLDRDQMVPVNGDIIAHEQRWELYTNAAALANETIPMDDNLIGNQWQLFTDLKDKANTFSNQLAGYNGSATPLAAPTTAKCQRIAGEAIVRVKDRFLDDYVGRVVEKIKAEFDFGNWTPKNASDSSNLLDSISRDLKAAKLKLTPQEKIKLQPIGEALVTGVINMQGKLGFPIFLDDDLNQPMKMPDLAALKFLLNPLMGALSDPAWNEILSDPAKVQAAANLKKCKGYNDVLAALINDDGRPANIKLSFLPPKESAMILSVFREADVLIGESKSGWQELPPHVGEDRVLLSSNGIVNASLQIKFRKSAFDKNSELILINEPVWGALRLIRAGQAQAADNGLDWLLHLKIEDVQQGINGFVDFAITPERPFPKREDWPRRQ
jgi:IcmF-related N-terminal domain